MVPLNFEFLMDNNNYDYNQKKKSNIISFIHNIMRPYELVALNFEFQFPMSYEISLNIVFWKKPPIKLNPQSYSLIFQHRNPYQRVLLLAWHPHRQRFHQTRSPRQKWRALQLLLKSVFIYSFNFKIQTTLIKFISQKFLQIFANFLYKTKYENESKLKKNSFRE